VAAVPDAGAVAATSVHPTPTGTRTPARPPAPPPAPMPAPAPDAPPPLAPARPPAPDAAPAHAPDAAPPPPDAATMEPEPIPADEPEEKPAVEVQPPFEVKSFADVQELVAAGRREEAIVGLERLRRTSPKNAYFAYYLGNLYFQRKWWTDGLESYEAAIAQNRTYRTRVLLIKNAIVALSSNKTAAKAQKILLRDVGAPAVPYLRAAAKGDASSAVRARATWLLRMLGRR